jgi:hypothetical protein
MRTAAWDAWVERARAVRIEDVLARRGIKLNGKNARCGPCPECGGEDRFAINIKKQAFNCRGCHARGRDAIALVRFLDGVDFVHAVETLTGEPPPKANGNVRANGARDSARPVVAEMYAYHDADGEIALVVERVEYRRPDGSFVMKDGKRKKTFRQKRPDPDQPDKWIWDAEGVPPLIFALPEITEAIAARHTIAIVEGEAKAVLLWKWDVPATCCPGGAKKWRAEHSEYLRGADVVVLPDNDPPGREHVDAAARSLAGIAKRVRVLDLAKFWPDMRTKDDVVNWAAAGHTREQLDALIERAPDYDGSMRADATDGNEKGRAKQPPAPFTAAEALKNMQFEPIKYVVPGVIVEGLTLLAAKPKFGKSWLMLHAAIAVARGGFTLGEIHCTEGDVLYCALEDNLRRLKSRMTKLLGSQQPWPKRLQFICEMPRLAEGGLTQIKEWIAAAPHPRLVIIDTLAMVRAPKKRDESSYDADYAAVRELRALANQHGIAIVAVHHLRKADADDAFDTVSGTLGLIGAPDTILVLKRDTTGTIVLHGRGRDLVEIEKAMTFNKDTCTWAIAGDVSEVRTSGERRAILDAMKEIGAPATPTEIAAIARLKPANVRRMMLRMAKDGLVRKCDYGKYEIANRDRDQTE